MKLRLGKLTKTICLIVSTVITTALYANSYFGKEYIVKFKNKEVFNKTYHESAFSAFVTDRHASGNLVKLKVRNDEQLAGLLQNAEDVEYVVPNFQLYAFENVVGEALLPQYSLEKIEAAKAWEKAGNTGSKKVVVAVIDTGVDYKHPALAPNMVPGKDFNGAGDDDPMDETGSRNPGHGTHCAGIIGASGLLENSIAGSSPVVSIMPIRFLGADGSGDLMAAIKSIDYAIENKVDVISASWGAAVSRSNATPLIEAVERADKAGIIFIAAASNDGKNNDEFEVYPANSGTPNMITVAASDSLDAKPYWSNYGKSSVSLAAPGDKIMSTLPQGTYKELSGTSMATPLVSGAVAFLKAQNPKLTGAEARSLLQATGDKVEIETACNCRINLHSAMEKLKEPLIVPVAASVMKGKTLKFSVMNQKMGKVKWVSMDEKIATIDEDGNLTGVDAGTTKIKAVLNRKELETLDIHVLGEESPDDPTTPPAQCPIDDAILCQAMCQLMPELPWCKS